MMLSFPRTVSRPTFKRSSKMPRSASRPTGPLTLSEKLQRLARIDRRQLAVVEHLVDCLLKSAIVLIVLLFSACQDPAVPHYQLSPAAPTVQIPTTLTLTGQAGAGTSAQTAQMTATLRDQERHGIPDVPLTFTTSHGTLEPTTVKTNLNGEARTTVSAGTDVRVSVSGAGLVAGMDVLINAPLSVSLSIGRAEKRVPTTLTASMTPEPTAPLRILWNFGDGQTAQTDVVTVKHAWPEDDRYTVSVTVTDAIERTGTASTSITVRDNPEPPAPPAPTPPPVPSPSLTVTVSAAPQSAHVGNPITFTAVPVLLNGAGAVVSYDWDFDGTNKTTSITPTVVFPYPAVGTFTAKVRANSSTLGLTATASVLIGIAP
jgi:PKD domain-containing protein